MLSKKIIEKIKRLELKAGHTVTNSLSGEYSSVFKGIGMEFEKVREYSSGDEIRSIDWNVTARMNTPFVKVFKEEREMTLMLIVDVSPSTNFGTTGRFKIEISTELGAILAYLATKNNDRVGLILFSDHVENYIPPKKGKAHIWRIIREILTHKGKGKKTNIQEALDFYLKITKRKSQVFLISDFLSTGYERSMQILKRKHTFVCVNVYDYKEIDLPNAGIVGVQDPETGQIISIDTSDKRVRNEFKELAKKKHENLNTFFIKNKIESFTVSTEDSTVQPLIDFLKRRERVMSR